MKLLLSILVLFPLFAFAIPPEISAKRASQETFDESFKRVSNALLISSITKDTPVENKVAIAKIDFKLVPKVTSYTELIQLFKLIRDTRFLHTADKPDFARRISWLYPDDGCYIRAALSGMKLDEVHLLRPAKIFVFGNLLVKTPYSKNGFVTWWYHVSSVVNYMGNYYVLDPSLNADAPTILSDWYYQMGNEKELSGIVCNAYTYDPFDNCYKAKPASDKRALKHQERFLKKEWRRIRSLGFDPLAYLGENPPWNLD